MPSYVIPDPETLRQEIRDSRERCKQQGVNPNAEQNPLQKRLSSEELSVRMEKNQDFMDIAISEIEELCQHTIGTGFAVCLADREGYILHIAGDATIVKDLKGCSCTPGYRWTEKDVGTCALSLALARQIPVQMNDDAHFCRQVHGHACSASPVFDPDDRFIGVIAMSGDAEKAHPHTLGMVIAVAKLIELHMRVRMTSHGVSASIEFSKPTPQKAHHRQGDERRLDAIEKEAIREMLEYTAFNLTSASSILGITRQTLSKKIMKYGLSKDSKDPHSKKEDTSDFYTVI